ncbi:MAG TPA: GNAT family N-acetyltransferase [Pyrinomonadaceae bacterium]|nr:GNAT family N-acetyltransferase [Pyrinomonadaceae bacterium]
MGIKSNAAALPTTAILTLRPARLEDSERLLAWRNERAALAASRTLLPIPFEEHARWFPASLCDPLKSIYIVEVEGEPAGYARAEWRGEAWELSWLLAPDHRGRRLSYPMVWALVESTHGPVEAYIRTGNVASRKAAEAAGLRLSGRDGDFLIYSNRIARP